MTGLIVLAVFTAVVVLVAAVEWHGERTVDRIAEEVFGK
jgi:hypothetical protein